MKHTSGCNDTRTCRSAMWSDVFEKTLGDTRTSAMPRRAVQMNTHTFVKFRYYARRTSSAIGVVCTLGFTEKKYCYSRQCSVIVSKCSSIKRCPILVYSDSNPIGIVHGIRISKKSVLLPPPVEALNVPCSPSTAAAHVFASCINYPRDRHWTLLNASSHTTAVLGAWISLRAVNYFLPSRFQASYFWLS